MRVLGIDHGTKITGWGLIEAKYGEPFRYISSGLFREQGTPYPEYLSAMAKSVADKLRDIKPDCVALEAPKDNRGFTTTQRLTELVGCLKYTCMNLGVPFSEIPPSTMKLIVTGNGWATKEEVANRISKLLNVSMEEIVGTTYYKQGIKKGQIKSYILDGSDALGLAIALPIFLKRSGGGLDYDPRGLIKA